MEKYCAKRKKEHEEQEKLKQEQKKKKEEEEKARLAKTVIKKEIKGSGLEKLAKPKDNLQKGKTMLFLKKMFPNDRILQKMIINEFRKNKLLKYPEEYDVYDSDEEIETIRRDEQKEPFKTAAREGRLLQIKDFTKNITSREKDITKPFEKYLEQKYLDSNLRIEDEKNQKTREQREEKQLNRFIAGRVRRYLELRKRRLYEKIPTLKEFLIKTYKEMHTSYKSATERKFPHITYGYSKRLKSKLFLLDYRLKLFLGNSYPVEFKRYFFLLVRAVSRGTKMSKGKSLLPFWAPPSAGSKSHVFLDTNKSYNKRVNELSKETKTRKIEDDYERNSCWQKEEFFMNRLSIMMTLSDAKECTFTPNVGSKMPNKHKELMQQEYAAWAGQYLNLDKSSFDVSVIVEGKNVNKNYSNGSMLWAQISQRDSLRSTSTVDSRKLSDTGKKNNISKPTKKLLKLSTSIISRNTLIQLMIPTSSRALCLVKKISSLKTKVISLKKISVISPMKDSSRMSISSSW